jgi:hypothetical protein
MSAKKSGSPSRLPLKLGVNRAAGLPFGFAPFDHAPFAKGAQGKQGKRGCPSASLPSRKALRASGASRVNRTPNG